MGLGHLVIFGIFALISWLISSQLKSRFKKYSLIGINRGMSGRDVAQQMLHDHGIYDVNISYNFV